MAPYFPDFIQSADLSILAWIQISETAEFSGYSLQLSCFFSKKPEKPDL